MAPAAETEARSNNKLESVLGCRSPAGMTLVQVVPYSSEAQQRISRLQ